MINAITIDRTTGDGRHAELLDVCERMGRGIYGSATNALAQLACKNPEFLQVLEEIRSADATRESKPPAESSFTKEPR